MYIIDLPCYYLAVHGFTQHHNISICLYFFMTQYILDKLFWPETPLLEAVGQHEPQVERMRERMSQAIQQAIIPLVAFSQQYVPYLDLMNLNVKSYIE